MNLKSIAWRMPVEGFHLDIGHHHSSLMLDCIEESDGALSQPSPSRVPSPHNFSSLRVGALGVCKLEMGVRNRNLRQ